MVAKLAITAFAEYSAAATIATEVISSIPTVQAFNAEAKLALEYDKRLVIAQKVGYQKAVVMACMFGTSWGVLYLAYGLAFCNFHHYFSDLTGQGSRMIASGELDVGLVLNVLFAVVIASFSLGQIANGIDPFTKATAASQKIFQTINRVPSIDPSSVDGNVPIDVLGDIEFKNVSFVYPSRPDGGSF